MPTLSVRPTLGLLTHGATDPNSRAVWAGVAAAARERDANLICFPGRAIHSRLGFEGQANILYELAGKENVDGLLIWLAGLGHRADPAEVAAFPRRFAPLPVVTIGLEIEAEPSVVIDNYSGMRVVTEHVLAEHGRKRPAFILGPARHRDAEDRYRAYCDALAAYGIPIRKELIVQGDFKESGGETAARVLLERGVRFDALIASSDNMAIGALKALQAAGRRVPDDVAVVGVNDESQSAFVTPPLTTAALWFYEQGYQAAAMLLARLRGEDGPQRVVLPPQLLIRQSCGCPDPLIARAGAPPAERGEGLEACEAALRRLADAAGPLLADQVAELGLAIMAACADELAGGQPGRFLATLRDALDAGETAGIPIATWQDVLSLLWRELGHCGDAPVDARLALWQQARIMVGETGQRRQAYYALQAEEQSRRLSRIDQSLSTTVDLAGLQDALADALPALDITACWLSLYEDPARPTAAARLLMGYDRNGRKEAGADDPAFPTANLVPPGALDPAQRHSLVAQPLYFRDDPLGLLVFEADPQQEEVYELLAGAISGALKRTQLLARNVELYKDAVRARLAAEDGRRLAEDANLLKSRFLATVSHELRTPLSLIVGTIEMMKREAERQRTLPDSYRHDLTSIHVSAQHLSRLISDVLDLASGQAGELRLNLRPALVADLLQRVSALGEPMARAKGLDWRTDIPGNLPLIHGDRTRLQQVALNLVANAVKFTERGAITLWAEVGHDKVVIAVSDTGLGIPIVEQEFIFDEFRQARAATQRGYGGMGLGLAISKRLVELHGGQIGVISTGSEGAGSTFYFTLPTQAAALPDAPTADRSRKVLLLTERAGHGNPVQAYLERRGFEVETVATADTPDWLNDIIASPPGALVLDYEPAAERGWELIETLKRDQSACELPILFYALPQGADSGVLLTLDYLTKPVGEDGLAAALERQGLAEHGRKPTILIVDDDAGMLDMHARMVRKRLPAATILRAQDGCQAIEALRGTRPDLVLLDLMMPVMDGFSVLERMRDERIAAGVPVIVLTAQILTAADMKRLQQGVAAVLGKGVFTPDEVLGLVEQTLARSRRLGPEAQRLVRQAMAYIHQHYAEDFSRSDLAASLAINERYLTRCFHDETGLTPFAYLTRYRIQRAKELLDATTFSITDIAQMVGFADASHFSRTFQREVGLAPRAYRGRSTPP